MKERAGARLACLQFRYLLRENLTRVCAMLHFHHLMCVNMVIGNVVCLYDQLVTP